MTVTACDIPSLSVLDRSAIDAACFRDSYRAPVSRTDASVIDIFIALFAPRYG